MTNYDKTEMALQIYNSLKAEIALIEIEIEDIKNKSVNLNSIDYTYKGGNTNKVSDPTQSTIIEWDGLESEIKHLEHEKKRKENIVKKIDVAMSILSEDEKEVIEYRYLKKMEWETVADYAYISRTGAIKRVKRAIKNMSEFIYERSKSVDL